MGSTIPEKSQSSGKNGSFISGVVQVIKTTPAGFTTNPPLRVLQDFSNDPIEYAVKELKKLGLHANPDGSAGVVKSQKPKAGTVVAVGSTVDLHVVKILTP